MMSPMSEQLIELVVLLRDGVLADVDLQSLPALFQVHEAGLAHAADGLDAAADLDGGAVGFKLFRRTRAVIGDDGRNGVREVEALAVALVAQRLDLFERRKTLFQKLLFERQ